MHFRDKQQKCLSEICERQLKYSLRKKWNKKKLQKQHITRKLLSFSFLNKMASMNKNSIFKLFNGSKFHSVFYSPFFSSDLPTWILFGWNENWNQNMRWIHVYLWTVIAYVSFKTSLINSIISNYYARTDWSFIRLN